MYKNIKRCFLETILGEQGWRSGENTRLHQCGPGSIPGLDVTCGLSLLLVLYSAPRGFSPGTPVFHSLQKPTFPNSNSIRMQDLPENHFAASGASWVNFTKYDVTLLTSYNILWVVWLFLFMGGVGGSLVAKVSLFAVPNSI